MKLRNPEQIVSKLRQMQREVRRAVVLAHEREGIRTVERVTEADTIYGIDQVIEPVIERFLEEWSKSLPMVVISEGLEPESGRTFPEGLPEDRAEVRIILDPIDGTRGLMYDKRAAWSLAGAAPNNGPQTRLRDIEAAVMTELPTSKMARGDVLWAIRGQGAAGAREDILDASLATPLRLHPSTADTIQHGFATVSNFFPGTKVLASELMEHLVRELIGPADVTRATVFEDQYISTGGQFYELILGHDRFNADLRPLFYRIQNQPEGLCCHPYDCATMLIAEELGVILTDALGNPLDGPLDVNTGLSWAGFANAQLRQSIEPLLLQFLQDKGLKKL